MIHALDLPRLRSEPSYALLLDTLQDLIVPAPTFLAPPPAPLDPGIITWLTRLVSSPLTHLGSEEREEVYKCASELLSTECGRTARPSMTRTFRVPRLSQIGSLQNEQDLNINTERDINCLEIEIHEPTLTADSLGLKTWSTSFLISRALDTIFPSITGQVLELGSGTGLLGIALAQLYEIQITLTDYLPAIVDNLQGNVDRNGVSACVALLDWTCPGTSLLANEQYDLIVASDFMYDASHAGLVVDMLMRFTRPGGQVLAAYPLRASNVDFIDDFKARMARTGQWDECKNGTESGYDDWGGSEATIVHWHIYRRHI